MAEACRIVKGEYLKKKQGRTCTLEMGTRGERGKRKGAWAELRLVGKQPISVATRGLPRAMTGLVQAMRARNPRAHHQPPFAELAPCIGMPCIIILPGHDAWPETSNRPNSPPRSSSLVMAPSRRARRRTPDRACSTRFARLHEGHRGAVDAAA